MTRRKFVYCLPAALNCFACNSRHPELLAVLREIENRDDTVIVGQGLSGFSVSGDRYGELKLPACCFYTPSVSSDGTLVSWFPPERDARGTSTEEETVLVSNGSAVQNVAIGRGHGILSSASSDGQQVAVLSTGPDLRVFYTKSRTQQKFSHIVDRFKPGLIERLQLSSDGRLMIVGSRTRFVVVEVASGSTVCETVGRFPSIAPDGRTLAFMENGHAFVQTIGPKVVAKPLLPGCKVTGVGGWSLAGRFVLAGKMGMTEELQTLIAIEVTSQGYVDIVPIGSSDASKYVWVKKRLLSPY